MEHPEQCPPADASQLGRIAPGLLAVALAQQLDIANILSVEIQHRG